MIASVPQVPGGLVVRIRRSHRRGRGSIPRLGSVFVFISYVQFCYSFMPVLFCTDDFRGACAVKGNGAVAGHVISQFAM